MDVGEDGVREDTFLVKPRLGILIDCSASMALEDQPGGEQGNRIKSRIDVAKEFLLADQMGTFKRLLEKYDVTIHGNDEPLEWVGGTLVSADSDMTPVTAGIRALRGADSKSGVDDHLLRLLQLDDRYFALVVMTDGLWTGRHRERAAEEARRKSVKVHTLAFGAGARSPLVIDEIQHPDVVTVNEDVVFDVFLTSHEPVGDEVFVSLMETGGERVLASASESAAGNSEVIRLRLRHTPAQVGEAEFRIVVASGTEDRRIVHDEDVATVQVAASDLNKTTLQRGLMLERGRYQPGENIVVAGDALRDARMDGFVITSQAGERRNLDAANPAGGRFQFLAEDSGRFTIHAVGVDGVSLSAKRRFEVALPADGITDSSNSTGHRLLQEFAAETDGTARDATLANWNALVDELIEQAPEPKTVHRRDMVE